MTENRQEAPGASSPFDRAVEGVVWFGGALSALLIVVVLGVVSVAIFNRYVLDAPVLWGDELIGYLLVALVMFGAAEALRRGDHIAIDILTAKATPRIRRLQLILSDVAVMAFAVILGWSTWGSIRFAYDFGSYSVGYIEISTWIPQIPLVVGAALLFLMSAARLVRHLRKAPGA